MLIDEVKLKKIDDAYCVVIDLGLVSMVTFATESWEEFKSHVEESMRANLTFLERIRDEFGAMAKERGESVPEYFAKEFPELF